MLQTSSRTVAVKYSFEDEQQANFMFSQRLTNSSCSVFKMLSITFVMQQT
jgi:hypothetical protein